MPSRVPGETAASKGPHIATVVFLVLVLSFSAMTIGGRLATSGSDAPVGSGVADDDMTLAFEGDNTLATSTLSDAPEGPATTWPAVSAEAIVAMDATSGQVIHAENADERRDVGSTVKIVTALVVRDQVNLDEEITIIDDDLVDPIVFSNMALVPGDTLTVEQLLEGLLIPSGSDGARALARHVGGTIDPDTEDPESAFVEAMNDKAASLGMTNSVFANPHGNDADGAYSTAWDLAIAAQALLADPVLADIVAMPGYTFTSVGLEAREYSAQSTNKLLTEGDTGMLGVKTGSTEAAGGCLVLAFEGNDGPPVILVTLGSDLTYEDGWIMTDARWDEARQLVEAIRQTMP